MAAKAKKIGGKQASPESGSTIHLTMAGLIGLCATLIGVTALVTHWLGSHGHDAPAAGQGQAVSPGGIASSGSAAPWGNLSTQDISIEQPEEYVSFEATTGRTASWIFPSLKPEEVRALLLKTGLSGDQADKAMAPGKVETDPARTVLHPDDALVLSLAADTRSKLYTELAQWPDNRYMHQPYHLPGGVFEDIFRSSGVDTATIEMVKKLMYPRGGNFYFSDIETALNQIKDKEGRLHLLKALTYQTAVLARLKLDQGTDIDKLLGYWCAGPWVRAKDLRPLFESIKRTPQGGTISLLYLLPPFARERLYTFPMPTKPGEVKMDCHWTALNFFNEEPDNRLEDPAYASKYIEENFYQIGKPSRCGDLVFLLDAKGGVIHSAVYIADDIVFTKNGINYAQPWILMRMKNLVTVYTLTEEPRVMYYRRKDS